MSNSIVRAVLLKSMLGLGVITLSAPILGVSAYAAPANEATAVANFNKLMTGVRSMTANFSQTTKAGNKNTTFSGSMAVQRQNNFRWETKSPAEQLIVASGGTLWIYDKDLKQATKQSMANQVGDTPALLLSGDPSQISRNFVITQPNAGKNYYVLKPKGSSANFRDLSVSFNGGRPVMMVLNDNIGQTTVIKFSNITMNGKISANSFSFTPPVGTDIINQ